MDILTLHGCGIEMKNGRSIGFIMVIMFIITGILPLLDTEGIQSGPIVQVTIDGQFIEVGTETTVTVFVYEMDGEVQVGIALKTVTPSVTLGSIEPGSLVTDVNGYCQFTYHAPDEIEGPTDVTVTATVENGAIDIQGSKDLKVTYKLYAVVTGPDQIEKGGKYQAYTVTVLANGEPQPGSYLTITAWGAGTLGNYGRETNSTGESSFTITPEDRTGSITVTIQLGKQDHMSSAISKMIYVVEELDPLDIEVVYDEHPFKNWGAHRFGVKVTRGGTIVPDIDVWFTASRGHFLENIISTGSEGTAWAVHIASSLSNDKWSGDVTINISVNDGAERISWTEDFFVDDRYVDLNAKLETYTGYGLKNGQVFPGDVITDTPHIKEVTIAGRIDHSADMTLDFILEDPEDNIVSSMIIADGLDSFDSRTIFNDIVNLYTVPADPVEGNYTLTYRLKDRDGIHTYKELLMWYQVHVSKEGIGDWTFMYYFAGDNDLATIMDRVTDRLDNEGTGGKFNAFSFFDRSYKFNDVEPYDGPQQDGARKWDIDDKKSHGTFYHDQVQSDESSTLMDFMRWASFLGPAENYCLVLSDHGYGHHGICEEERSFTTDIMKPNKIAGVLNTFSHHRRKIEVIVLSGCKMAELSTSARLAPYVNYQVSPQTDLYKHHGLDTQKVFSHLKSNYDWDSHTPNPIQVGSDFLSGFNEVAGGTEFDAQVSLFDSNILLEFISAYNDLFKDIVENWSLLGETIYDAYMEVEKREGPWEGKFEYADLLQFLYSIRDHLIGYINHPVGHSIFTSTMELIDSYEDVIINSNSIDGDCGLNVQMPRRETYLAMDQYLSYYWNSVYDNFRRCVSLIFNHDNPNAGSDDEDEDDDIFNPLDPVDGQIIDEDGIGDAVVINLNPRQNYTRAVTKIILDCHMAGTLGSGPTNGSLKLRRVIEGSNEDQQIKLKFPERGVYNIAIKVLDEDNRIIQEDRVGPFFMNVSNITDPEPNISIGSSLSDIYVGDEIEFTTDIQDISGYEISWDLDHRDGVYIDSFSDKVQWRYMRSGNVSVNCVISDGIWTYSECLDIEVLEKVGNEPPVAGMTARLVDNVTMILDGAVLSSDPEAGSLEYRFNFGDGNWTDWDDGGITTHRYSNEGIYNCSLIVRDRRGNTSDRVYLKVDTRDLSALPNIGELPLKKSANVGMEVVIDIPETGTDDGLLFFIDWGDGNSTRDYSPDMIFKHTYSVEGDFYLTIRAMDPDGLETLEHILIEVHGEEDEGPFPILVPILIGVALLLIMIIVLVVFVTRRGTSIEE